MSLRALNLEDETNSTRNGIDSTINGIDSTIWNYESRT